MTAGKFSASFTSVCRILSKYTSQDHKLKITSHIIDSTLVLEINGGKYPGKLYYNLLGRHASGISAVWESILEEKKAEVSDAMDFAKKEETLDEIYGQI